MLVDLFLDEDQELPATSFTIAVADEPKSGMPPTDGHMPVDPVDFGGSVLTIT
jgi:hypothetical protein